jgi:hypothetical protein
VRRFDAAAAGAALLFVVYVLTAAPDVTFWDAGEFIAAAHALGIPHPPGTPLYVFLVNVWAKILFFLPFALATNLLSAVTTALAAWLSARMIQRATGSGAMAMAAALAAGGMSSVWLNATETEVYAVSLALGIAMVWTGDRAGREAGERWTYLTAYLMVLAVPLHLSALVAAPAAILLAAHSASGIRVRRALVLSGSFVVAMGVGRVSWWMVAVGAVIVLSSLAVRREAAYAGSRALPFGAIGAMLLAASALAFMYVRAQFDPGINQGSPDTFTSLSDVIARRQYAVSPPWPRTAPIWVQLANVGQYADWQVALSTGPTVLPSVLRSLGTALFLWLGYAGAVQHWKSDRRTWNALMLLLISGTIGVMVYLNLRAGPSIGYGILPADITREARERDYFFVFGFWVWGLWAGMGAVAIARRSHPAWVGVLIAMIPIILNWRAVTRRGEPEESLPRGVAEALLGAAPQRAVLFVAGDNDTYPLWYAQQVLGQRRDVTVITIPLLPTRWYRAELARRHQLLDSLDVERYKPRLGSAAAVAAGARRIGRPVATAITVTPRERDALGPSWTAAGFAYVDGPGVIDTVATARWATWVRERLPRTETRAAIDPVNSYFRKLLECPRQLLERARTDTTSRLDSLCNYR